MARRTLVLDARQTATLLSPGRLEILEALGALDRASARDLAAHLGRSAGAVYHHVRALEAAGLIRSVARRPGPRRPEAIYAVAAERLAVTAGRRPGDAAQAAGALRAVLRQAARDADRVLAARDLPALEGRMQGGQMTAPLGAAEVRGIIRRLNEIETIFRNANRRRRGSREIYRWTSLLLPVRTRTP
jgi:DNA-binding transcriptional ArsR family regulator